MLAPDATGVEVFATVSQSGTERVYAVSRDTSVWAAGSGTLAWVRGSFCSSLGGGRLPAPDDPADWMQAESLMRLMLSRFGYSIRFAKPSVETRSPLILSARHRNGFFLSSYAPSTNSVVRLRFPHGAPLLIGMETWMEDGHSTYSLPRAAHKEVRCLVDQSASGELSCVESIPEYPFIQRRLLLKGLKNATVHFYPETHASDRPARDHAGQRHTHIQSGFAALRAGGRWNAACHARRYGNSPHLLVTGR